jgi:hypothetical protein
LIRWQRSQAQLAAYANRFRKALFYHWYGPSCAKRYALLKGSYLVEPVYLCLLSWFQHHFLVSVNDLVLSSSGRCNLRAAQIHHLAGRRWFPG